MSALKAMRELFERVKMEGNAELSKLTKCTMQYLVEANAQ
jgi:hypothetical protein